MGITSNQNHKLFSSETIEFLLSATMWLSYSCNEFSPLHFLLSKLNHSVCLHKIVIQVFINKLKLSVIFLFDFMVYYRMVKMPEVETDTNPIDRTVAHLLFHRPVDFAGKHPDTPESPVSTKLPCEHKTVGIAKLSMGSLPDSPKSKPNFSQQGSKLSSLLTNFQPAGQCKSNPCLDTSEDASNNGPADEVAREVKASE